MTASLRAAVPGHLPRLRELGSAEGRGNLPPFNIYQARLYAALSAGEQGDTGDTPARRDDCNYRAMEGRKEGPTSSPGGQALAPRRGEPARPAAPPHPRRGGTQAAAAAPSPAGPQRHRPRGLALPRRRSVSARAPAGGDGGEATPRLRRPPLTCSGSMAQAAAAGPAAGAQ